MKMDKRRWVRKVYEEGRRSVESNARANTWCSLTRKWMLELGFGAEWDAQEATGDWQARVRAAIMELEQRQWRERIATRPKLDFYARWKKTIEREEYLESKNSTTRRLWTKMRTGCLELRIETGRWERVSVQGRQVPVPRELRLCHLCGAETEDAEHLLLRCPAYERERRTLLQSGQRAGIDLAESEEWWKWIFGGGGGEVARQLLYKCMQKRKRLLEGMGVQCK